MTPPVPRAFVVGDIAGSCALWNRHAELMAEALAEHDAAANEAVAAAGGRTVKHTGDGFLAEFETVDDAVTAMVAYQQALAPGQLATPIGLRSRVAIHWGAAAQRDGDWFGPTINHLMRVADVVEPTHVVLSRPALDALDGRHGSTMLALGALTVRDIPEPVELYAVETTTSVGPPLTRRAGVGLPTFASGFVGRGEELARVREQLERHRLVTVVGFGGMGKTRLAVEAAATWQERHEAPVHFVDLVADPEPAAAVASALGVLPGETPESTVERVVAYVGNRQVLVVLDNCEHVIDGIAAVAEQLLTAPNLILVATSREALELDGEVLHPLAGMDQPAALQLLQRRLEARGLASVDDAVAGRLVDAVDRLPLGIELVAGRLRSQDPSGLADQLEASTATLANRRRGSSKGRHASLDALVEWSTDLIGPAEHGLAWTLAHFPASIPPSALPLALELVEAGGSLDGSAGLHGLDALDDLVAKSLLQRGADRLRMLSVVRHRLLELGPPDALDPDSGNEMLVRWARGYAPPASRPGDRQFDLQTARSFSDEAANLDAALEASVQLQRPDDEAAILVGLWPLAIMATGRSWFNRRIRGAMERSRDTEQEQEVLALALTTGEHRHVDDDLRARVVGRLLEVDPDRTWSLWRTVAFGEQLQALLSVPILKGDPEVPRAALRELHAQAVADGDERDQCSAQVFLAFSHLLGETPADARAPAEEAGRLARRFGIEPMVALADATASLAMTAAGEHELACHVAETAVPLAEGARWESVVRTASLLARLAAHGPEAVAVDLIELIDFVVADGVPFVIFDGIAAVAEWELATGDHEAVQATLAHSSIARSPATCAVLWHVAQRVEFELGLERFTDALVPAAFERRADAATVHLSSVRARVIAGLDDSVQLN